MQVRENKQANQLIKDLEADIMFRKDYLNILKELNKKQLQPAYARVKNNSNITLVDKNGQQDPTSDLHLAKLFCENVDKINYLVNDIKAKENYIASTKERLQFQEKQIQQEKKDLKRLPAYIQELDELKNKNAHLLTTEEKNLIGQLIFQSNQNMIEEAKANLLKAVKNMISDLKGKYKDSLK